MTELMSSTPHTRRTTKIVVWSGVLSLVFALLAVALGYYFVFAQMGAQCFGTEEKEDTCVEWMWPISDAGIHAGPVVLLLAIWILVALRLRAGRKVWTVWFFGFTALYVNFLVWVIVKGYAMGTPSLMIFGGAPQ